MRAGSWFVWGVDRSKDATPIAQPVQPEPSATTGMSIAQRILHVGGRNNAAGYIEFGSIQAVEALVRQVLRDLLPPEQEPVQPASSGAVTHEENEKFSHDVSDFKGSDPEATKYALEAFLSRRTKTIAQPDRDRPQAEAGRMGHRCSDWLLSAGGSIVFDWGIDMTKQPEALRLADRLDPLTRKYLDNLTCSIASVELRRLHEVNAELLEALKACLQCFDEMHGRKPAFVEDSIAMSKEAIAKATGDKT